MGKSRIVLIRGLCRVRSSQERGTGPHLDDDDEEEGRKRRRGKKLLMMMMMMVARMMVVIIIVTTVQRFLLPDSSTNKGRSSNCSNKPGSVWL